MLFVFGEIRRHPLGTEFPRCGEEYIPYHLFNKIGGVSVSAARNSETLKTQGGKIVRYKKSQLFGPLRTFDSDRKVRKILEGLLKEKKMGVANIHSFLPRSSAFLKNKGTRVIITSHGGFPSFQNLPLWKRPLAGLRKRVEASSIRSADLLVAINKYMVGEYERYQTKKPVKLIYSGVDTHLYKPQNGKWNEPLKVVFLSRLHPQKGIWEFIELAKSSDAEFIIIGHDQLNLNNRIRTFIKDHPNIKFFPDASEQTKVELLGKSHLFVSLSKGYDPTPNVLYEAMGSGMAIASTLKHYREDVLEDKAIWINRWQDVLPYLDDKKLLQSRARKLRKSAERFFNTERMAKEYKGLGKISL
ncbi:glycosyltransferase [Candidatus Bathyarchaeota archaeon]|nr:glycosyltransferase [Candidatus Bathyarchaeota archaeon]